MLEQKNLEDLINSVFTEVKSRGDEALKAYTKQFDGVDLRELRCSNEEIEEAKSVVTEELKSAIKQAKANIERFHKTQLQPKSKEVETTEGVVCWREQRAIQKVGFYIPGGTAPLFSSVLMLGVPASLSGCKEIVLCSPPNNEGKIHPAILYTADLVGIKSIYKVGGAQAIAAMAIGTQSIPAVFKIFGPGNQYVTAAKMKAQQLGIAIDMPAGPSEVLVIADATANPRFVAADLLSQAEHGIDSQVILLSDNLQLIEDVNDELVQQLAALPRKKIAQEALSHSKSVLFHSLEECLKASNFYAPEHLILASDEGDNLLSEIQNAGSVFVGHYSCESLGDYASGTNHTLPTHGYAANYSGVSIDSFMKQVTFQKVSAQGIQNIGPAVEIMAEAESLFAHKNAVTTRLNALK